MSKSVKVVRHALAVLVFTSGLTGVVMADPAWEKHHPRRDEVNNRLAIEDKRKEVKQGEITKAQAAALHKDDHKIRQQERDMAHMDHGHITKLDQKALNQQENLVSKDIGK